jgi:hypothetical protein
MRGKWEIPLLVLRCVGRINFNIVFSFYVYWCLPPVGDV